VQGRELALEDKQTRLQKKYEEKYKQLGATRGVGGAAK
jgi:hypothetical protein